MSQNLRHPPSTEELLGEDTAVPPLSQVSQEPLHAIAYRLRDLPSTDELLGEDTAVPPLSQVSQEPLQAVAYRTRAAG
jgi:hypothetical protein